MDDDDDDALDDDDDDEIATTTVNGVKTTTKGNSIAGPAGRGSGKAAKFKDEDGDGAPDTLTDLFKVFAAKAPVPPPAPLPVARREDATKTAAAPHAPAPTLSKLISVPSGAAAVAPQSQPGSQARPVPAPVVTTPPSKIPGARDQAPTTAVATVATAAVGNTATATTPQGPPSVGRVVPAGQGASSNLQLPSLPQRSSELLAVNVKPATLQRAQQLGYIVQPPEQLRSLGMVLSRLILPPGTDPAAAKALLGSGADAPTVAINNVYHPIRSANEGGAAAAATPAVPGAGCSSSRCYGATAINWQPALSSCARNVRVGVIDTGIDTAHPTFARRSVHVGNVHDGTRRLPVSSHGTGVLALMAGDPASSTPGLIPDAEFYTADIFYADANGAPVSDTAHLLRALEFMDVWNVRVINLSLAGPRDDLVEKAVEKLAKKGVLMVAAAGNEGPGSAPAYPAAYPQVIAVTAVNRDKRAYRQANQGNYIDMAAPGVDIWTALPKGSQGMLSGTSLAAPFVASVVASVYQGLPEKNKRAVLARLDYQDLGLPGRDPVYGNGLVLAPAACAASEAVAAASRPIAPSPPAAAAPAKPAEASVFDVLSWHTNTVTRPAALGMTNR
ncbi:MAG: S8 family serine peptidase [Hyphomicrobiaceae bacterium]